MTTVKLTAELMAGAALVALAGPAAAQTQAAPASPDAAQTSEPETLSTVEQDGTVVIRAPRYVPQSGLVANKTDIPLIQMPQSVSAITRDQIDLLDFVDAQQAVRYAACFYGAPRQVLAAITRKF